MEFDSFDFVRVKANHYVSQSQKGLALVVGNRQTENMVIAHRPGNEATV
jgi:hypothetical protein